MLLPQNDTKILLIGRGLRKIERMIDTFNMVGADLLFADDAQEGLMLMSFERPDFVICDSELPEEAAADLCRTIRSDSSLRDTPVVFAGEASHGVNAVISALNAGADDFLTEHFDPGNFLAKVIWMMDQKTDEIVQRREYENLRRRQLQTLDIVRQTSELFSVLANDRAMSGDPDVTNDQRIELGLEMIKSLAGILEEQIEAVDGLFGRDDSRTSAGAAAAAPKRLDQGMELALPM